MHHYKELIVWQKSVDLAVEMYQLTKRFPSEERYGIIAQMRRCGISIASNIAEGAGRNTAGEFGNFLGIAEGSANELETQAIISCRLSFLTADELQKIQHSIREIRNMLFRLKQSL